MSAPVLKIASPIRSDFKQRLRLRRFLLASAFSLLYLVVLAAFHTQGKVDRETLLQACVIVAALILAFFVVFRLDLNLHFPDPSLTEWQLLGSVFTMLYVVYRAPDTRIAFTAFFFVALMFGMLRHSGTKLTVLGSVSLLSFLIVSALRYRSNGDLEMLRLDMLQLIVMAVTLPWFVFIGVRVKRLQRGLTEATIKLEDIEEKASHDELTGIYNRRALLVAMEEAKRGADFTGEPLSICVIDLDFFKRYNDEFDHLTGDRVLRAFAQTVQQGLRATDVFGRYGGEEFVQIMRHTTLPGAMADAERLRERISAFEVPTPRPLDHLTVSIGVAQYETGETIIQTFARADEALYKAKQRGRNRVEC
jgi:diguanylate cyclase (GGDEF)-like protein